MHGDTIEILPIDYAIVFVWNMGERERLNNENLDSDYFAYVSRVKPRQLVNYHHFECTYENWVNLRLGDFFYSEKHPVRGLHARGSGRLR